MKVRYCIDCSVAMEVHKNSGKLRCGPCNEERGRERSRKHYHKTVDDGRRKLYCQSLKETGAARRTHLKSTYGITPEQYAELLKKQEGRCWTCQRPHTDFKKNLAVDHDHTTGEIRGLLCDFCNRRLIGRHRSAELFERATAYLKQGTGWFVPPKPKKKRRKRSPKNI